MRKDSLSITLTPFCIPFDCPNCLSVLEGMSSESQCSFTLGLYLRAADTSAISRIKISLRPHLFHLSSKLTLFMTLRDAGLLIPRI